MNTVAFIIILACVQAVSMYLGKRSSSELKSQEDYFLAGKSVRFLPLMTTFLATQVGGGLVLGAAEESYRYGWQVILYPLGAALGLIALGLGLGRRLAKFKVSTVAQIFEVTYGSKSLKQFASVLSIVSLFMILVAQFMASNKFLTSLGLDGKLFSVLFWSVVIFYTAAGGLKGVVSIDIFQSLFFSAALLSCFVAVYFTVTLPPVQEVAQFDLGGAKLTGWLLMPMLFMTIEQDMAQRCFAGDSPRTVSRATLVAGICTLAVCSIPVYFGVLANTLGVTAPAGSSILFAVISQTSGPMLASVAGVAILVVIISTAVSLINAIGSNIALDFEVSKSNVTLSRIITIVIATSGIFFSFYFNNVVDLLIQSYELSVSCLFASIVIALFKRECKLISAALSILFGVGSFATFQFVNIAFPHELASIIISFVGYGIGELLPASLAKRTCCASASAS